MFTLKCILNPAVSFHGLVGKVLELKNSKEYQLCFVSFIQPIRYWICQSVSQSVTTPITWFLVFPRSCIIFQLPVLLFSHFSPVTRLFPSCDFDQLPWTCHVFYQWRHLFPSLSLRTVPPATRIFPALSTLHVVKQFSRGFWLSC